MKLLARIVLPFFTAPAIAMVPAGLANADNTSISVPTMSIGLASVTDGIRVCFTGTSHVVGPWTAHIAGVRTALSPVQVPISFDFVNPGSTSVNECPIIAKYFSPAGQFEMTFEYAGGSGSTTTDRPAALHGVAWWVTGQPDGWLVTTGG